MALAGNWLMVPFDVLKASVFAKKLSIERLREEAIRLWTFTWAPGAKRMPFWLMR